MARPYAPPSKGALLLGALLVVVAGAFVVFLLARGGGGASEEQAVRAWFLSPDGGSAPQGLVSAIHVGVCSFTDAESQSRAVLKCPITTDAPTPTLHTCFVFSGGSVLRGGWQLAALDACNALRFDGHTGELVDIASRTHYRLKAR